jgi:hypothetical protein
MRSTDNKGFNMVDFYIVNAPAFLTGKGIPLLRSPDGF